MDFKSPVWVTSGRWVAERVQCGRVKAKLGRTLSGCVGPGDKISLFLQDRELAKVALSCHVALDMLCQEMHEAW